MSDHHGHHHGDGPNWYNRLMLGLVALLVIAMIIAMTISVRHP